MIFNLTYDDQDFDDERDRCDDDPRAAKARFMNAKVRFDQIVERARMETTSPYDALEFAKVYKLALTGDDRFEAALSKLDLKLKSFFEGVLRAQCGGAK